MGEVIITAAVSKGDFFQTAGEKHISCSLASRQGAMSALIRSVCSARTHVCSLWTLENPWLSHTQVLTQHIYLIYHRGKTDHIQMRLVKDIVHFQALTHWHNQGFEPRSCKWGELNACVFSQVILVGCTQQLTLGQSTEGQRLGSKPSHTGNEKSIMSSSILQLAGSGCPHLCGLILISPHLKQPCSCLITAPVES